MNAVETVFGVVVLLMAGASVILSLVVVIVWLWGVLRRIVARNRPPTVEAEYRAMVERQ
jgi:uncharacterized membrane protein YqiK